MYARPPALRTPNILSLATLALMRNGYRTDVQPRSNAFEGTDLDWYTVYFKTVLV
jgi:hypothetical protein